MLENINQAFQYKKLSQEDMTKRGILGRLVGPIADTINPTRNGRKYTSDLWEKVFADPIMQEKINNRCLFGEIGHPTDRTETDPEKIALCLAETPKKAKDGKLWGVFDILDTPNGRILKAMCDYGCNIGVSSRGEGDVIEDIDGNESVDPDSYQCFAWDAVFLPAVPEARVKLVAESLERKRYNKTLKQKLTEEVNKASVSDKKIMKETLDKLNIKLDENLYNTDDPEREVKEECNTEECADKEVQNEAVEDNEALVKELQEALKAKTESEANVLKLQNKLAVGDAKVKSLEEELSKYKNLAIKLSDKAKDNKSLVNKVAQLQESIKQKDLTINKLNESVSTKEANRRKLNESIKAKEVETKKLVEELTDAKADAELKQAQAEKKLAHANKLVEAYKKAANETMKTFIESKATMLGVSISEIRKRLPKSYTVNDVNQICEDLQAYQLNISKLPFNVTNMKFKASKNDNLKIENLADEIDDDLLEMAKLK